MRPFARPPPRRYLPTPMAQRPFLILIVLDGFGCRKEREFNAIAEASKPRFDRLFRESPWTTLEASGNAVGLPAGQMGNSEVGHVNIGAGRIVEHRLRHGPYRRIDDLRAVRGIGPRLLERLRPHISIGP